MCSFVLKMSSESWNQAYATSPLSIFQHIFLGVVIRENPSRNVRTYPTFQAALRFLLLLEMAGLFDVMERDGRTLIYVRLEHLMQDAHIIVLELCIEEARCYVGLLYLLGYWVANTFCVSRRTMMIQLV